MEFLLAIPPRVRFAPLLYLSPKSECVSKTRTHADTHKQAAALIGETRKVHRLSWRLRGGKRHATSFAEMDVINLVGSAATMAIDDSNGPRHDYSSNWDGSAAPTTPAIYILRTDTAPLAPRARRRKRCRFTQSTNHAHMVPHRRLKF